MKNTILYILLPCYNAEKTIKRAIDSVYDRLSSEIRLLIVNDGSSDWSENIIEWYLMNNEFISYVTQDNCWLSNALWTWIERIKKHVDRGTICYIARLDSDDEYTRTGAIDLYSKLKKDHWKYMCYLWGLLNEDWSFFSFIKKPDQYFSYEESMWCEVATSLDSVSWILNLEVFYNEKYSYDKVPSRWGDGIPTMRVMRDFWFFMTDIYFYIVHHEPYSLSRRLISLEYANLALEVNRILLNEFFIPENNKREICLKSLICSRYSAVIKEYRDSFYYLKLWIKNICKDVDKKTIILYVGMIFVCLWPWWYKIVNFFVKKFLFKK